MKHENKHPEENETPVPEGAPVNAEDASVDVRCTEIEALKKETERLLAENQELKDARLRLLAEFDNYKRRTARESVRMIESANESLIKELIPVLENFERALDPSHKENDVQAFYKGVELIYNLFNDKLKKAGVCEHNPVGEEFDSEKHEAVMHAVCQDVPENKISQVLQKGYSLNNKMIKYAKVAVSKGNS